MQGEINERICDIYNNIKWSYDGSATIAAMRKDVRTHEIQRARDIGDHVIARIAAQLTADVSLDCATNFCDEVEN